MISSFVERFIEDIVTDTNYSKDEKEQIKYVTKVLLYELIKLTAVILLFALAGYFKECIFIIAIMCITKPFLGGYHEDTQIKCFVVTNILVLLIIILYENITLNLISSIGLSTLSLFCIYNQVPVINEKMPLSNKKLIKRNRIIAIFNNFFLVVMALVFHKYWFSELIIWTSIIQTMLLFNKHKK